MWRQGPGGKKIELFNKHIQQVKSFLDQKRSEGRIVESCCREKTRWPESTNKTLVLGHDTAVELGSPKQASTSFLLWTNRESAIQSGRITIVGPDIPDIPARQTAFGKIVIVGGSDFNEENSYQRYRAMERVRYNVHLEGYMMRGASQFQREWSRVSRDAMKKGFSLHTLGRALMGKYFELEFVTAVEIIFITSATEDVLEMRCISDNAMKIICAMNKMAGEMSFDCDTCEYADVCGDVAALRAMRKTYMKEERTTHA